jgi:SAM-dependent methyltransferase
MLKSGAAHVTAVDISAENLRSVERNLKQFGFLNFDCRQSTLEDIRADDEFFDFVWCNGVLMHTAQPDLCLQELARVLKRGGQSWIYVYGSNGFYWYLINQFRSWFRDISPQETLDCLQLMGLEVRYIGEYMDDWKVPYLRSYTNKDFSTRLAEVGFGEVRRLWRGMSYDTCERLHKFPDDSPWLGEGDLRYLLTKTSHAPSLKGVPLSADEYGSRPEFAPEIAQAFAPRLEGLKDKVGTNLVLGLVVAANLQRRLRDLMTMNDRFDVAAFQKFIDVNLGAAGTLTAAASGK